MLVFMDQCVNSVSSTVMTSLEYWKKLIPRKAQFPTMYGALKAYLCVIFDDRFQSIYKLCERSKIGT